MKSLTLLFAVCLSVNAWAQGQVLGEQPLSNDGDEVIISQEVFENLNLEDPVFSSRKGVRDVATFSADSNREALEWQGQLAVVKEIPYSYPWLTHTTLQLRTLNEIEAEEIKKAQQ